MSREFEHVQIVDSPGETRALAENLSTIYHYFGDLRNRATEGVEDRMVAS